MRHGLIATTLAATLVAAGARAQVVHGRVVESAADAPVATAAVRLLADSVEVDAAFTDSTGSFTVQAADAGSFRLSADRLGYRAATSRPFALRDGDTLRVLFRLAPDTVLLQPLQVVSRRRLTQRLRDFYARVDRGPGRFVTREELERRHPVNTTDLFFNIPGIRVVPSRRGAGNGVRGRGGCVPVVFIDGMRVVNGADEVDMWIPPMDLEGIEVYHGPETPVEYTGPGGAACGAVLFWTRID